GSLHLSSGFTHWILLKRFQFLAHSRRGANKDSNNRDATPDRNVIRTDFPDARRGGVTVLSSSNKCETRGQIPGFAGPTPQLPSGSPACPPHHTKCPHIYMPKAPALLPESASHRSIESRFRRQVLCVPGSRKSRTAGRTAP